jgi:hypothetical protein
MYWKLFIVDGRYVQAYGVVANHPRFSDGTFIYTSSVRTAEFGEDGQSVNLRTKSGSFYQLAVSDIDIDHEDFIADTRSAFEYLGVDTSFLKDIQDFVENQALKADADIGATLENGDLYLRFVGTSAVLAYFKADKSVLRLRPYTHVGTRQDSIMLQARGIVDYRYFPQEFQTITTYHRSDGILRLVIENAGTTPIEFDSNAIEDGKTVVLPVSEHIYREGLFSPDCV